MITNPARCMKKWAAALQSDDADFAIRAFAGRGTDAKVFPALARFAKSRYRELGGKGAGNYRQTVAAEVADYFDRAEPRERL